MNKQLLLLAFISLYFISFGQNVPNNLKQISTDKNGIELEFVTPNYGFQEVLLGESSMQAVHMTGSLLPNDPGCPDLPAISKYIAIPTGSTPVLTFTAKSFATAKQIDIAPAPILPAEVDDGPGEYIKNQELYNKNAFYPENPVIISTVQNIRGVEVVLVSITPFQYNPVTKELRSFEGFDINISFEGEKGEFGDNRLRSRFFDPMLSDLLVNYDMLPKIDYAARTNNSLGSKEEGCEYLIIIPNGDDFASWADTIWAFRQNQGISTKIVSLEDIGGNSYDEIREYIKDAYEDWDTPPAAVLLMADYGSNADNSITSGTVSHPYSGSCISDNKYADVNNDNLPDMAFARMTAQNNTHLETMVTKFINYEQNPPTNEDFYNKPVTALGWQTERWFQLCSEIIGGYYRSIGKDPVRINAIYEGSQNVWSTATNTSTILNYFGPNGLNYIPTSPSTLGGWSGGTASQVVNAINDGAFVVNHRDHGYEAGWGEPSFSSSNITQLSNDANELPFVFSMNCLTGKFNQYSPCFTEKFHRHTKNGHNAGALGLIAATEISYSFVNDAFMWGIQDNLIEDFMPAYTSDPVSRGFLPCFANAAGKYFLKQSSWPYNGGSKTITYYLFHHHGDAFTTVFNEMPQDLTIEHPAQIDQNVEEIMVTADEGAQIAITVNNEILGVAVGTGAPIAVPIIAYGGEDDLMITITKQNFFRYEAYIPLNLGPIVWSNSDTTLCTGSTLQLDATANNYNTIEWTTTGTGTYNDVTILNPIYTPSEEDYTSLGLDLIITVSNGDENSQDTTVVNFRSTPEVSAVPEGETSLCINPESLIYAVENIVSADTYEWELTPTNAGGFSSDSSSVKINWLNDFVGNAFLKVRSINTCGTSEWSEELQINIYDTPETPTIPEGNNTICGLTETTFVAPETLYAESFEWELLPEDAGTTEVLDGSIVITFTKFGAATLRTKAINSCDQSEWSETLDITIEEQLQSPVVTGEFNPCLSSVETYTIEAIDGATGYEWSIIPEGAGAITANDLSCDITWRTEEIGDASIIVVALGENCNSNPSETISTLKDCTGIENFATTDISIYPNPSTGLFHIKLNEQKEELIYKVHNNLGQLVKTGKIEQGSSQKTLDLNSMNKGVYFINIKGENLNILERILIK